MINMPIYYPRRSTLKRIIYEYNQYDIITLSKMLSGEQSNILGIVIPQVQNSPDIVYTQMLYNTLQKYMYAEIGFDTDEQFIDRFNSRWDSYAEYYHDLISKIYSSDSGLFNRLISRSGTNNISENITVNGNQTSENKDNSSTTRTVDDTITGTSTGIGDKTEYNIQTQTSNANNNTNSQQDRSETETHENTNNKTSTDTRTEESTHDTTTEQNVTETEITAEKFGLYQKMISFIDDFSDLFGNLFMQIFTT